MDSSDIGCSKEGTTNPRAVVVVGGLHVSGYGLGVLGGKAPSPDRMKPIHLDPSPPLRPSFMFVMEASLQILCSGTDSPGRALRFVV